MTPGDFWAAFPGAGILLLLLKEGISSWRRHVARAKDTTEATLKSIVEKLDAVQGAIHKHNVDASVLAEKVAFLALEVGRLREDSRRYASDISAINIRIESLRDVVAGEEKKRSA